MKPIQLVTRRASISAEAIAVLEENLALAKTGAIIAVAVAAITADGACQTQVCATDHHVTLMGAVARLAHRMQINADDSNEL